MFKRLFFFGICLTFICFFTLSNNAPIFLKFSDNFEVYTVNYSSSSEIINVNALTYRFIFSKKGESASIERDKFNLSDFLSSMNAKIIFTEQVEDRNIYYAYSPSIKYLKVIGDKKINLQICVKTDSVKVGSPLIFGSF